MFVFKYIKKFSDKDFLLVDSLYKKFIQYNKRIRFSGIVSEEFLKFQNHIKDMIDDKVYGGGVYFEDLQLLEDYIGKEITRHRITYISSSIIKNTSHQFYQKYLSQIFNQIENFNPDDYIFWIEIVN